MPKKYEEFAAQVTGCNALFQSEVKKKADELNKINADWRWSPKGKEEQKKKAFDELQGTADNLTKVFKEAVSRFMAEYGVSLPEDNKDHSIDIQNALKIIDMLGFDLDEKNVTNILNPLKGSFKNLKTILDVIRAKDQNGQPEVAGVKLHYSPEVRRVIDEVSGLNTDVYEYIEFIGNIQDIIDNPAGYRFEAETVSNAPVTVIRDYIPYSFLACGDWMKEAGERYAVLENQFSSLFKVHVPTDQEMIEDILKTSY